MKSTLQGGFIRWIILVIVIIIALSYFGFDIRAIVENDQTQDNIGYVWGFVVMIWENYLSAPVLWIWENIVLFIWRDLFLNNLDRLRDGETFSDLAPETPSVDSTR
jgi:hypothetical protein